MLAGKRILAVITARGGSKGLPRKNVLPLGGMPLVEWSVRAARASRYVDRVILSSDDAEIIAAARHAGCEVPFVRPAELASDTATSADVLLHALAEAGDGFDYLLLLQPTSPFRSAEDIDAAIRICVERGAPACVSVTAAGKPPQIMYRIERERLVPLFPEFRGVSRRQDLPAAYVPNGAVYVAAIPWFKAQRTFYTDETHAYLMPPERSVDIDSRLDLLHAEAVLQAGLLDAAHG